MIVFDSGALIALVNAEPGDLVVKQLLRDHKNECLIHAVNLLEVHYDAERAQNANHAHRVLEIIDRIGVVTRIDLDVAFLQDASFLKVNYKMSLADTFGIALARRLGCQSVSTDHHELDEVKAGSVCDVLFIR